MCIHLHFNHWGYIYAYICTCIWQKSDNRLSKVFETKQGTIGFWTASFLWGFIVLLPHSMQTYTPNSVPLVSFMYACMCMARDGWADLLWPRVCIGGGCVNRSCARVCVAILHVIYELHVHVHVYVGVPLFLQACTHAQSRTYAHAHTYTMTHKRINIQTHTGHSGMCIHRRMFFCIFIWSHCRRPKMELQTACRRHKLASVVHRRALEI